MTAAVAALAAYYALPVRWQTPIIAQVMLPAHAATSGEGDASTRYFVDTTNEEGHFHLLTVEIPAAQTPSQAAAAGNLTARFVHVNNRRLVRREGAIDFAVGATGYLYTTATGGSACNTRWSAAPIPW